MNVVLESSALFPPITGIGRYAAEIANGMQQRAEVDVFRHYYQGRAYTPKAFHRLTSQPSPGTAAGGLPARLRRRLLRELEGLRQRGGEPCLNSDNTVFHAPNFLLPEVPWPAVLTVHDLSVLKYPEFHPENRIRALAATLPAALSAARLVITDSRFIAAELIDRTRVDAGKLRTVPLGVSAEFCPREESEVAGLLADHDLVYGGYCLVVGTVEPRKNLDVLLDVYDSVLAELSESWPLVVVGHRGWRSEVVHRRMQGLVKAGTLRYLDYLAEHELPLLYAGARAFACPSHYEGFGLPVLEAMASGVPVICSKAEALVELAGRCALLADANSRAQWHAALLQAMTDEAWRRSAIDAGLECATRYRWDSCIARLLTIYREVLE